MRKVIMLSWIVLLAISTALFAATELKIKPDSTDVTTNIQLVDSTDGHTPETGLTITNIDMTYVRERAAAVKADTTALGAVDAAHSDNHAIAIDDTNAPGVYRFDWPDAAFASGVRFVTLVLTCTGVEPEVITIDLSTSNANVTQWLDTACATPSVSGVPEVDITYINGEDCSAGNSSAILSLRQLTIQNGSGNAVNFIATNINAKALNLSATNTGSTALNAEGVAYDIKGDITGNLSGTVSGVSLSDVNDVITANQTTIIADTNEIQVDQVDGGRLDLIWDATSTLAASDNIGINWADISNPTSTVGLTNTTIGTVSTLTGHTPQTGDSYAIVNNANYGNAKLVRATTPANTLDVSATGEAGIDWSNVGGKTATVALTNTTIGTVTVNSDKTGYKLASDGLDSVSVSEPSGNPTGWDFRDWLFWLPKIRFGGKTTCDNNWLKSYTAGDSELTKQSVSDDGTTQTIGKVQLP